MKNILQKIQKSNPHILVIGEKILDEWYYGKYSRPCQEEPSIHIHSRKKDDFLFQWGGAYGVFRNLLALTSVSSRNFLSNLPEQNSTKTRFADKKTGKILFRSDHDRECKPLFMPTLKVIHEPNIIISDYGKGFLDWGILKQIAEKFPEKRIIFSPHVTTCATVPDDLTPFEKWIWVVNLDESLHLSGKIPHIHAIIRTTGTKPVTWRADAHAEVCGQEPITPIPIPHPVAVGDVFLAGFSAAYCSDVGLEQSIQFAIRCCSLALKSGRRGSHCLKKEDFKDVLG